LIRRPPPVGSDGRSLAPDASSLRWGVSYSALLWALAVGAPQPAAAAPSETVIHDFQGAPTDGQNPQNALVIDETGALYGTTSAGGSARCTLTEFRKPSTVIGCGTVFRPTPPTAGKTNWSETVPYSFPATNISQKKERFGPHTADPGALTYDGAVLGEPYDSVSPLDGAASSGGAFEDGYVFEPVPPAQGKTGWIATTLYDFGSSSADGAHPKLLCARRHRLHRRRGASRRADHGQGGEPLRHDLPW
jgi:hypothetical protein